MKFMNVRLTFIEGILGTCPSNADIYREFIGSKAEDATTIEGEVAALGVDAVAQKGTTIFPKLDDKKCRIKSKGEDGNTVEQACGTPFLYDYQIKGYFKDTCGGLRKVKDSKSSKIKAFKKEIDKLVFPQPRIIPFENVDAIDICQRPLRAQTMQGERVSLACSEEIPAGATITFSIGLFLDDYYDVVKEWLNYGMFSGIGQWRNSGKGRFYWEELDDNGNVIGGNLPNVKDV